MNTAHCIKRTGPCLVKGFHLHSINEPQQKVEVDAADLQAAIQALQTSAALPLDDGKVSKAVGLAQDALRRLGVPLAGES